MHYEWDEAKAAFNAGKHGVPFEAVERFVWETAIVEADLRRPYGEDRFRAMGTIDGRLHALVFVNRGERIRLISLRKCNDREWRAYDRKRASKT